MVMGGEEQALAATEEACRVYVGNLLPKAKEIHLTSKFARFGIIHSVWIARRPPGFAFVRFAAPDAAQRAVEACREEGAMEILGKAVRVQMAGDKDRKTEPKSRSKEVDDLRSRRRSHSSGHRGRAKDSRYGRGRSSSRSSEMDGRGRRCRRSSSRSRGSSRRDRHKDRSRSRSAQRDKSMSRSRRRDASRSSSRSRDHEGTRRRRRGRRDYRSSSRS